VCRGKGVWNAEDIRLYHLKAPEICKTSCGDKHRAPNFESFEKALKSIEDALEVLAKKLGLSVHVVLPSDTTKR
jgi:hypothetical protein